MLSLAMRAYASQVGSYRVQALKVAKRRLKPVPLREHLYQVVCAERSAFESKSITGRKIVLISPHELEALVRQRLIETSCSLSDRIDDPESPPTIRVKVGGRVTHVIVIHADCSFHIEEM